MASNLSKQISEQLDHYFSDVNIVNDPFLLRTLREDDGWISLDVMMRFGKLKKLAMEKNRLVQAIKDVEPQLVEFDEHRGKLKRKLPLPDIESFRKELDERTVQISGFPTEDFDFIHKWCSKFGEVESVRIQRRHRKYSGHVHVVFKTYFEARSCPLKFSY